MPYTSIDEEEQLRRQLEAERKAQEEAAKAEREAAEQTEKAQKEAAEATAAAEEQAKAAQEQTNEQMNETAQGTAPLDPAVPINPAAPETPDPMYTGVRSGGMGRITAQDKLNAQFMREEREAIQDTGFKVSAYDTAEGYDQSKNKAHMTSMLVGHAADLPTEEESGNKVSIDYRSVRNKEQAYALMMVYSDDAAKVKGGKKLASALGMDFESFLAEAENYMYDKYGKNVFSMPYSPAAKNRAYTAALNEVGLTDIAGNVLDIQKANPADVIQACKMDPSGATADAVYAVVQKMTKVPGNPWYGMSVDKDMFAFVESSELTKSDYNDHVKNINQSFTYSNGYTDDNMAAYMSMYEDIQAEYGENKRVTGYLVRELNKSFADHTGLKAPTQEQADRALAETEAMRADAVNGAKNREEAREGIFNAFGDWLSSGVDWIKNLGNAEAKASGEAEGEESEFTTVEQIIKDLETPKSSGSSSASPIMGGGTANVNGQELGVSKPIASAGEMPPTSDLFPAEGQTGEFYGPTEQADSRLESRAYDPNMTGEQAWMAHQAGYTLDPRNEELIARWTNPEISGVVYGTNAASVSAYLEGGNQQPPGASAYGAKASGVITPDAAVHGYRKYGAELGKVANNLAASNLKGEARASAECALMDIAADLFDMAATPYTNSRPAGTNLYDYGLSQRPELLEKLQSVDDLIKQANGSYSENVVNAQEERDARMMGYQQAAANGTATPEMLAAMADYYAQDWVDVEADEWRNELMNSTNGRDSFFAEDGLFWQGESMAAIEGRNIRTAGGMQGFADFSQDLQQATQDVIDSYTTAAHNIGMTLKEYLSSAGITGIDQLADIAYNGIQSQGRALYEDEELRTAINAAHDNPTDTTAILGTNKLRFGDQVGLGAEIGVIDYAEGFAQASYMMLDMATYDVVRQSNENEYRNKYGDQASAMYRRDLNEMIASGMLSQEMAAELKANMDRAYNIFDVGYEIDPNGLKGFLRQTQAELGKRVELLQAVKGTLVPEQQRIIDFVSSGASSLTGMAVNAATMGAGKLLGAGATVSRVAGAIAGTGMNAFEDAYDQNVHVKGMSSATAAKAAFGEAAAMTIIEHCTPDSMTVVLFGDAAVDGARLAARKNLPAFARATLGWYMKENAQEGFEEGFQTLTGGIFDLMDSEWQAYDRGEGFSVSRLMKTMESGLRETDYAALGKEVLTSFGGGFAMGAVFNLFGVAGGTRMALKDAQAFRKYESVSLATQIAEGTIEATDENLGRLHSALREDLNDPAFCRYVDKSSVQATKDRQVMTAMLEGVEADTLYAATDHAAKAKEYESKAAAASTASNMAKSRFLEIGERVENGQAKPSEMDDALAQWQKAQTAYTEAKNAANKEADAASRDTKVWLKACQERGNALTSEGMKVRMNQISSLRMGLAKRLDVLYSAMEDARVQYGEAVQRDAAAQREVDYAEGAVFSEEAEIDAEGVATENNEDIFSMLDYAEMIGQQSDYGEATADEMEEFLSVRDRSLQYMLDLLNRAKDALDNQNNITAYNELAKKYNEIRDRVSGIYELGKATPVLKEKSEPEIVLLEEPEMSTRIRELYARQAELEAKQLAEIEMSEGFVFREAEPEENTDQAETALAVDEEEIRDLFRSIEAAKQRVENVLSHGESAGMTKEQVDEYVESERTPLRERKRRIIAREKGRFNDAFNRMMQALEMDNEDAANEIQAEYDGIAARLQSLGVDTDALTMEQYGIAPEEANAAYEAAQEQEAQRAADEEYGRLTDSLARRMEATSANLEAINPARRYFARNSIYVNRSQTADIFAAEDIKSISQFNRRYHTKLTTKESDGAMPLDSHVLSDINAEAVGSVNVDGDPIAEMLRVMQSGKELTATQRAEKAEAKTLAEDRKRVESTRRERVKDVVTGTTKEQREAAQAEQRAQDNVDAMDAEAFIEEKYPNATDEEKAEIRKHFASGTKKTPGEMPKNVAAFAARIAKKFKVPIKFVDSLDGAEGEYDGKSILIARDATQGEVVRKVILHELTHKAEGSALYKKLSGTILDMKYGGDQARMDADIQSTISRYQAFYDQKGRKDKFTETNARQEIVADFMGEILDGNQELIDRLVADEPSVAQKIVDTIKGAIDKLRGVKDSEVDKMRKAVRLFERAIKKAKKTSGKAQNSIPAQAEAKAETLEENVKFSLPSGDALDAEIRAWRAGHQSQIDAALTNDGVSQFAEKTVQRAVSVPVQVKREFQTNPLLRSYAKDTNAAQLERAMGNIERDGYEAEVNRLLDAETFSAEDTVEAGAIAISAFEAGDVSTGLEMALKYRTVGTEQAQAMQSRKMFAGMSPTHIKLKVAGEAEQTLSDFIAGHQPKAKEVNDRAKTADDLIRDMQGGDESTRVMEDGDYTFDASNSKWGVPINEKQRKLIDHYKLNNVARPGLYYNRATTKQRMLEAILATPDPDANSGNGLTLTQRLEWMKEGKAVVTQADLDYIADQIRQYSEMPEADQAARAGDLALARAFEAYGNIKQPTKLEKARTWRYVSMLLSLPSAERNVIGNSVMNAVNAATHDTVGVFADWVTSLFTGQRTTANISFKERSDGWNAWADETANTFRDYFLDKADATPSAQGEDRFNKNQRGRVYQTKAFEDMRLVEGFLMSVGDRNFWKKAYVNSLAEQQRVADMNGIELDYDKACEIAKTEANYATFNEDNFLRNWLSEARKNPYVGFVLDMVMPFTGVPTNITKRMVEYSPIGMAMTFLKHGGRAMTGANFDQRSFVEGISRGLSGTALWMIGMGLGQLGAIDLGTGGEDDEKVYNLKASLGEQYSPFIRIGDENISLAAFAPAISPIIMGATAYEALKEDDNKRQAFTNALTASMDQIFDASYMSGLSDLFDKNGTIAGNVFNTFVSNAISQNVPAFMTQIATAMDPYVRDTKDADAIMQAVKNGLIARIPGVREQYLNEKTDIAGQAFESKEGIRNFIDPFTTTKVNDDPALIELDRLYDELGSSTHIPSYLVKTSGKVTVLAKIADDRRVNMDRSAGDNKLTLTANERNHYNRLYSTLCFEGTGDTKYQKVGKVDTKFEGIRDVMASRKYQRASDEEKAETISDVISKAKLLTQAQMVIDKGYVY